MFVKNGAFLQTIYYEGAFVYRHVWLTVFIWFCTCHGGEGDDVLPVCEKICMSTFVSLGGHNFSFKCICVCVCVCVCVFVCVRVWVCFVRACWKCSILDQCTKRWILHRAGPGPKGWHPARFSEKSFCRQMLQKIFLQADAAFLQADLLAGRC